MRSIFFSSEQTISGLPTTSELLHKKCNINKDQVLHVLHLSTLVTIDHLYHKYSLENVKIKYSSFVSIKTGIPCRLGN